MGYFKKTLKGYGTPTPPNGALVLVSFYRNGEQSAFERHQSRVPFDKTQDNIFAVKKHLTNFLVFRSWLQN